MFKKYTWTKVMMKGKVKLLHFAKMCIILSYNSTDIGNLVTAVE